MDHVAPKVWFACVGAAIAWSLQLIIGYALLAHACYPGSEPLDFAAAIGARAAAATVTALTLIIALAALTTAVRLVTAWEGESIRFGKAAALADQDGVPRYLAFAGILIGIVFSLLIVFNGLALILEATCRFA